jgi:hypothetical protein
MSRSPIAVAFILSAFDREQWCPVLQALFHVDDLDALRSILGAAADGDGELQRQYLLNREQLSAIVGQFGISFDPSGLPGGMPDIFIFRKSALSETPYLVHTGYELPLLLDGRKKLARMNHEYPPMEFMGEERFDHWVSRGMLRKTVICEPFDRPIREWLGHRTVYYTLPGEEWRAPAMQLVWRAAGRAGGWNEYFERLEGMLFGYGDAENDWWIDVGPGGGGFGGVPICCAVGREGLAWIEAAGFRALPPVDRPTIRLRRYSRRDEAKLTDSLFDEPHAAAVVRANVLGRHLGKLIDLRSANPWDLPSDRIPILNRHLRGSVVVVAQRA